MKSISFLLVLFLFSTCLGISFTGNGSGTEADPYQITTLEQLQEMNNELDAHYILMNDIDASETKEWNDGAGFDPIGNFTSDTPANSFTGSLVGQNYTIKELFIERRNEGYIGFFGCIADGGNVYDVNVEKGYVIGSSSVGIFVGSVYAYAEASEVKIDNCSSDGMVIVDFNTSAGGYCGGFCGSNYAQSGSIIISNCYSKGLNKSFHASVGGFCGMNSAGKGGKATIINCYSLNRVDGLDETGGFCGLNYASSGVASIFNCMSNGFILCGFYTGGFCSGNSAVDEGYAIISNCYSTVSSSGLYSAGFCMTNNSDEGKAIISNCYSTGSGIENSYVSGFCRLRDGNGVEKVNYCYWDIETSRIDSSSGGTGKTTAEMMMQSTFINWDFDEVWCMVEGKTYPHLQAIEDCETLPVEENTIAEKHGIRIYPNPADEYISISMNQTNHSFERIQIINLLGVRVWNGRAMSDKIEINVSTFPSGVYFIRIGKANKMFIKK